MDKVEGKIVLQAEHLTPEQVLDAEIYLNDVIANIVYANKGIGIRVHLNEK